MKKIAKSSRVGARNGGFAMLLVLMVVAIGIILGLSYVSSAAIKATSSRNLLQANRAHFLAESGMQHGLYLLWTNQTALDNTSEAHPLGPYTADSTGQTYFLWATPDLGVPGKYEVTAKASNGNATGKSSAIALRTVPYDQGIMAKNPTGYWRMGDTSGDEAEDSTSNDNDLDTNGGVTKGTGGALPGDADKAMTFDGVNDYLDHEADSGLRIQGDLTVSLWFKMTALPTDKYTLVTCSNSGGKPQDNSTYQLVVNSSGDLEYLQEYGNGKDQANTFSGMNISAGVWHNMVVTREQGTRTIKVYMEGNLAATWVYDDGGPPHPNSGKDDALFIGSQWGEGQFFKGSMDEVAIIPQALSATDIKNLNNSGTAASKLQVIKWNY